VELDPLNKYCYLWNLPGGFQFSGMPTCWPPSAAHPVIVLITVQGLLPITNRAGKSGYLKEQHQLAEQSAHGRAFTSEMLKNIFI